ncbi:MAG: hypothetical protein KW788_01110 [Candidatus Doudnabacteria bacterium]|nr:hypothetical protein [Candidatus Doudnabacteria bacterium]
MHSVWIEHKGNQIYLKSSDDFELSQVGAITEAESSIDGDVAVVSFPHGHETQAATFFRRLVERFRRQGFEVNRGVYISPYIITDDGLYMTVQ